MPALYIRKHELKYTLQTQLINMSATTLTVCSRHCHLLEVSLRELSYQSRHACTYGLFHVVDFDYYYADVLVVGVVVDFGDVPVFGEEEEELIGGGVVEAGFGGIVIVVDHVGFVFTVGNGGLMVDDAEPFSAFHCILEVDFLSVAF